MAAIDRLPDEISLKIVRHMREDDVHPSKDLRKLSLISRKFRRIAQEALYTSISLRRPNEYHAIRVGRLVRTVIERPELSKLIRELKVVVVYGQDKHVNGCPQRAMDGAPESPRNVCQCGWQDNGKLLEKFRGEAPSFGELDRLGHQEWAWEHNLVGLLLSRLTSLRSLTILPCYRRYPSSFHSEMITSKCSPPASWFDSFATKPEPSRLDSFTHLSSIHCHRPLPWSMMCIPHVKAIEIGLPNELLHYTHPETDRYERRALGLPLPCPNIESLSITMDGRPVSKKLCHACRIYGYYVELVSSMCNLKELKIFPRLIYDNTDITFSMLASSRASVISYERLLEPVGPTSLKTLIIDPKDVPPSCFETRHLRKFTGLKHLVAPLEILPPGNESSLTNLLPQSLRTIDLIYHTKTSSFQSKAFSWQNTVTKDPRASALRTNRRTSLVQGFANIYIDSGPDDIVPRTLDIHDDPNLSTWWKRSKLGMTWTGSLTIGELDDVLHSVEVNGISIGQVKSKRQSRFPCFMPSPCNCM